MGYHAGWWAYLSHNEKQDRPDVNRSLLLRVWDYANPYRWKVLGLLITIFLISGLSLLPPLFIRALIDNAIPNENVRC